MSNLKQEKPDSYKTLAIYQKSECIYDVTYHFVNNFLNKSKDRTVDQMVQAARSSWKVTATLKVRRSLSTSYL